MWHSNKHISEVETGHIDWRKVFCGPCIFGGDLCEPVLLQGYSLFVIRLKYYNLPTAMKFMQKLIHTLYYLILLFYSLEVMEVAANAGNSNITQTIPEISKLYR